MTNKSAEKTYSTRDFSFKLNLYQDSVTKACKSGEIKAVKNDTGRWVIPESELLRIAAEQKKQEMKNNG